MQKVTTILAIVGVALIAAALIGIVYAQVSTQTPTPSPTSPPNSQPDNQVPYCYGQEEDLPPNCYYGQAAEYNSAPQVCHGYGSTQQDGTQYPYGGMMGGRGMMNGWGMHGRDW